MCPHYSGNNMRKFALIFLLSCTLLIMPTLAQNEITFTVQVANVSGIPIYENMGVADIPIGAESPAPILPGESYQITFPAFMAESFAFVTMIAESNDLFIGTVEGGIMLYDENGDAPNGDITDQLLLLDLGTEVNEHIGVGTNQAPRQSAPNTGKDEQAVVRSVDDLADGLIYPVVSDIIRVHIEQAEVSGLGDGDFYVVVENVSGDSDFPTALTPIVWALHFEAAPFFQRGEADYGHGLERLAEDGNAQPLAHTIGGTPFTTPITPIIWAVHNAPDILFTSGQADRGEGLESLAEDGNGSALAQVVAGYQSGIASVPSGANEASPALPEQRYSYLCLPLPPVIISVLLLCWFSLMICLSLTPIQLALLYLMRRAIPSLAMLHGKFLFGI